MTTRGFKEEACATYTWLLTLDNRVMKPIMAVCAKVAELTKRYR